MPLTKPFGTIPRLGEYVATNVSPTAGFESPPIAVKLVVPKLAILYVAPAIIIDTGNIVVASSIVLEKDGVHPSTNAVFVPP